MRVVSLLPSATETLGLIGGSVLLVGRSHECDCPTEILDRPPLTTPRTTGANPAEIDLEVHGALTTGRSLYRLDGALFADLRPDVILTQSLCSGCSIDEATLRKAIAGIDPPPRVVSLNPTTIEGVFDAVLAVGSAVGLESAAKDAVVSLRERFYRTAECVPVFADGPCVAFLEWTDPLFVGGHWIPQLIERAGARHPLNPTAAMPGLGSGIAAQHDQRRAGPSVRVSADELVASQPDAVVICPCGFDLDRTRDAAGRLSAEPWWPDLGAVRAGRVALVDGAQMFSRPGPRLVDAFGWLTGWLNDRPDLIPPGFPWEPML